MNIIRLPLLACAFATCLLAAGAAQAAQEDEDAMDTDRPGLAESAGVVGKGRVQLETGVQQEYSRDDGSRVRTLLVPTLLRFGVGDGLEIRIEGDTYNRMHETPPGGVGQRSEGLAPTSVGMKLSLGEAAGSEGVSTAAIVRYYPRSGSGDFRSAHATGDLRLAAGWELAPKWSLNPNLGVGFYEDDAQRRYTSALAAATLGYDATKSLNLFIDASARYPERRNGGSGALVDVGAAYLIGRDLKVDFSVGSRVAGTTFPRLFLAAGVSRRF
jgi:hypothetical protein